MLLLKRIVLIFLITFIEIAFSFEIKGIVKDAKTLIPLNGANVMVQGTTLGASCDGNGLFVIMGVRTGRYTLAISMMGYKNKTINIEVGPELNTPLEIRLTPIILQMPSIQVSGESFRNVILQPELESAALIVSTSTIPWQQIEKEAAKTVVDALNFVPGAFIESRGRKVKQFISVRGQRYPYPDYAIDGVWQKEFLEMPYIFSASDIEKIEVVRSSAVLLTGLSTMAGVINIQTKAYQKRETNYELEYGSYNTMRGHLSHGSRIGNFSYSTGLGYFKTGGPADKHAAEEVANLFAKLQWQPLKRLSLQSSAIYYQASRDFVTAVPPADPKLWLILEKFDPQKNLLMTFKGQYVASDKASTEFKFSYADRKPTYESFDTQTNEKIRYVEADREWNANFIQAISPFANNTIRAGFFYNHWIAPNGKRFYYGKACNTETFAGVLIDEHQFGRLHLDAGFRWEKTHFNEYGAFGIDGSAKGFANVTPIVDEWQKPMISSTFGVVFNFDDRTSLHFHSAYGKIEPREGTIDANLIEPKNESQLKMDLGVTRSSERFGQISFITFAADQKNAIALSGKTLKLNGRVMELYLNRDQYQIGIETEWRAFPLWSGTQPFVNAIYMISRAEHEGKMVHNEELPSFILNSGVYQKWKFLDLNILIKYVSAFKSTRFLATSANMPAIPQLLGDFLAVDAILGWNIRAIHNLRLILEIRNMTNENYATVVGYPDFGRRISVGIRQGW
ncbi:TonB-dependent receptor [candidate division KSB1 bacterium]|nr:TonB-dependent receptor [candidate division KSB1 bacterium]